MKKISSLILLMAVLFAVNSSFAQPQMKIQVFGGYNIPLAGLGGNSNFPSTDPTTNYLYMKSGFNAGADFKYFLGKKRNLGLLLNVAYNGYTTGDLTVNGTGIGTFKANDVRVAVGAEWDFIPKSAKKTFVDPFVGIDLVGNFLSGKFTSDGNVEGALSGTMNSASRFGIGFGAGVDIMVKKTWGFVIGAKYDWMNLIGKQDNTTQTTSGGSYYLTDKAYTDAAGNSVKALQMMDIQFYGGVTFAFGEPKKITMKK